MIDIQIHDLNLYNKLKSKAIYASDITHVCRFGDSLLNELINYNLIDKSEEERFKQNNSIQSTVSVHNVGGRNIVYVDKANYDLYSFLSIENKNDPWRAYTSLNELKILIDNDLVKPDESFNLAYTRMTLFRSKLSDLNCYTYKLRGKGSISDYIDDNLKVKDILALRKDTYISYKSLNLRIIDIHDEEKRKVLILEDNTGNQYMTYLYGYISFINKYVYTLYNNIKILTNNLQDNRYYQVTGKYYTLINNMIVIPEELDIHKIKFTSELSRKIPANMFRMICYELDYRVNI